MHRFMGVSLISAGTYHLSTILYQTETNICNSTLSVCPSSQGARALGLVRPMKARGNPSDPSQAREECSGNKKPPQRAVGSGRHGYQSASTLYSPRGASWVSRWITSSGARGSGCGATSYCADWSSITEWKKVLTFPFKSLGWGCVSIQRFLSANG